MKEKPKKRTAKKKPPKKKESLGPIVRTGTTPSFWANWDNVFGSGREIEDLFQSEAMEDLSATALAFIDVNEELKRYFAKHPHKLYDLTPRKFEELIASILEDFGFEVELTQATRDGGRDIIAFIRNAVCSYLTYVECKKYAPDNKIGVGLIRSVAGVHHLRSPNKSLICTTGFFTKDAVEEARLIEQKLELKDYNDIKAWLKRYAAT